MGYNRAKDLELVHDFIQWVFPLPEESLFNRQSPTLTREELDLFRTDVELREQVKKAVGVYSSFLLRTTHWLRFYDHNHLRITRALRFLTLADFPGEAAALHSKVRGRMGRVSAPESFLYWERALQSREDVPWR
jgi:hypothetical protein